MAGAGDNGLWNAICDVIEKSLAGERVQAFESVDRLPLVDTRRVMTTGRLYQLS